MCREFFSLHLVYRGSKSLLITVLNCVKNCQVNLFADDNLLYISCDNYVEAVTKLNEDIENVFDWLGFNKLALNVSKTKAMVITLNDIKLTEKLKIGGCEIDLVEEFKYLGVALDRKSNFNGFLIFLKNKMLAKYHVLKRLKKKPRLGISLIRFDIC